MISGPMGGVQGVVKRGGKGSGKKGGFPSRRKMPLKGLRKGWHIMMLYRERPDGALLDQKYYYEGTITDKRVGWDNRESYVELSGCLKLNEEGEIISKEGTKRLFDAFIDECDEVEEIERPYSTAYKAAHGIGGMVGSSTSSSSGEGGGMMPGMMGMMPMGMPMMMPQMMGMPMMGMMPAAPMMGMMPMQMPMMGMMPMAAAPSMQSMAAAGAVPSQAQAGAGCAGQAGAAMVPGSAMAATASMGSPMAPFQGGAAAENAALPEPKNKEVMVSESDRAGFCKAGPAMPPSGLQDAGVPMTAFNYDRRSRSRSRG